ncbi:MAG: hypothetical protein ABSF38_07190 [Verrucomicrobiota bacterium]|jgi:hypothetical protein
MNRPARKPSRPRWRGPLLLAVALAAASGAARAADLRLQATLIWGANDSPATVNHQLAGPALSASLRSCTASKWTNYYEITNLTTVIPLQQSRDVKMSDRCTLKIRNLGSGQVAIDCIARGQQISKGTNTLPLILGSNETNKTAWFVSLRAADAASGDTANQEGRK